MSAKIVVLLTGLAICTTNAQTRSPAPAAPVVPARPNLPPGAALQTGPDLPSQPTPPLSPTAPSQPTLPTPAMPPGANQFEQLPPDARNRLLSSNGIVTGTNSMFRTNSPGFGTNRFFGTNQFFGTNSFGTNQLGVNNQTPIFWQDRAVSLADRRMLMQIRTRVQPFVQPGVPSATVLPVNFFVQDNVVTVMGQVPNEAQKRQIITVAEQTPGVLRVVDQLNVNSQLNLNGMGNGAVQGAISGTNQVQVPMNPNLTPTGR